MARKSMGRMAQEMNEGLPTQETMVPNSRFQQRQQIQNADEALDTGAPDSSFQKKKVEAKGSVLKQEVAASVVKSGVGGSIPETSSGTYSLTYSGNEGTVLASAAYTPIAGQSRSDSRIGKKLDAVAKKINFVASEQVEQEFTESKALAENPEAVMGYNGSYRNTNARAQKVEGGVPGALLYQRSVDEIKRNQLYYSLGQHVSVDGVETGDTPKYSVTKTTAGVWTYPSEENYDLKRGNYLPRALRVKFNSSGKLSKFSFDYVDACTDVSASAANKAAANATLDRNAAEMARQKMDAKAGDEKADLWTPLARAIKEPTATVALLRDLEAITGSEVFMAYKKTAACHSYQLNRAAKDGMKTHTPMTEALLGLLFPEHSSADLASISDPFSMTNVAYGDSYYGSSALMISAFDSTTKYKSKADLLTMPRSFKMHLQTADNNMNPLRVKKEFAQAVTSREVFSTIDRDYDPLMPVCISDRAAIIHPYNFNDLYAWNELNSDGTRKYLKAPFKYMYSDLRNNYIVEASVPLLAGIAAYLEANSAAFMSKIGNKELIIPILHSTCFFSMWSLLVLASTPFILNERVNSMRDVLYYESNVEYPFAQLVTIKDANPMGAVNYENTDYQQPLVTKQMVPSVRITWIMPEIFWPFDELSAADRFRYVLPWYMNEQEFDFSASGCTYNPDKCYMTVPSVRSGARLAYLDDLYSMSERDVRMSLDRLVQLPSLVTEKTDENDTESYFGVYKYDQNSDGIPFVTMGAAQFTLQKFLSLAREQGYFLVAPFGLLDCNQTRSTTAGQFTAANHGHYGDTSYLIKFWHGQGARSVDGSGSGENILSATSINVNRASAYKQDWDALSAGEIAAASNDVDYGWVPALGMLFAGGSKTPTVGKGVFHPFTSGITTNGSQTQLTDDAFAIVSLQKALWTRVQMLPFALSPFDCALRARAAGEDGLKIDPFDFLYFFGLAGFRASDYREDVYNRENEMANLGFQFLTDPFIRECPVFKEAAASLGIDTTPSV